MQTVRFSSPLLIRLWLFLGTLAALAQTQPPAYDFSEADRILMEGAAANSPGLQLVLVQNGQTIYSKRYGGWDEGRVVAVASSSKWLSAAVILSLVDSGTLSLDDTIGQYMPDAPADKRSITIRQMFSHTAGWGDDPICLYNPFTDASDCVNEILRTPLPYQPGTAFHYGGSGMQVAGRIAELASGQNWATLFSERVAIPVGMRSTSFTLPSLRNPQVAGGAVSSAEDFARFVTMIYQRGVIEGKRVLSTRALDIMLSDQTGGVRIASSFYSNYTGLSPSAARNRYGIGNWLEARETGSGSDENSSQGLFGFSPLYDRSRNLVVVLAAQSQLSSVQPFYYRLKQALRSAIPASRVTPFGVTSAASFESGPVVPNGFITIFGSAIGPETPAGVSLLASGQVSTITGGVRVLFDGLAAPMIAAARNQVSAVAPVAISGKPSTRIEVEFQGVKTAGVDIPVNPGWPALFTADSSGRGQAAALNQDGTLNGPETASPPGSARPASSGEIVVLFGTGAGATDPPVQDGTVSPLPQGKYTQPVSVWIGGRPAEVLFAGPAAGVAGALMQINARIPVETERGNVPVVVQVGANRSLPNAWISVR